MAKKAYIGVDNLARKIKKGYVGVDGVARKIKKAYLGIGGVARPCWSGGELAYYGLVPELSEPRRSVATITHGKYAMFVGGQDYMSSSTGKRTVEVYDPSLTVTKATDLSFTYYSQLAAAVAGDYALFGANTYMNAYNTSLTRTTATALSTSRSSLAGASIGGYALFGGGMGNSSMSSYSVVDAYNASLTRSTPTALSANRMRLSAVTVGGHALFVGGCSQYTSDDAVRKNTVDAYDASLTRTVAATLTTARYGMGATTVGEHALFAGGNQADSWRSAQAVAVETYNTSLTKGTATDLSNKRSGLAAVTLGDYALFAGGSQSQSSSTSAYVYDVDAYDVSLTRTLPAKLQQYLMGPVGAVTGDYAIFGMSRYWDSATNLTHTYLEAYTLA